MALQAYIPSIMAILMALVFVKWPWIAALMMSGALIVFAIFYASIVYRFRQFRNRARQSGEAVTIDMGPDADAFGSWDDANFKNVSFYMRRRF